MPISYGQLTAEVLATLCGGHSDGSFHKLVEIGGGTGGTTAHLLSVAAKHGLEYWFTDLSAGLVHQASARWREFSNLHFHVLDIERMPDPGVFPHGSFDIVLAANVLHATKDLRVTLSHVRRLLRPGGVLLLLESTRVERWMELTFGLTEGWWRFEDSELRSDGPLLSADRWTRILLEAGFEKANAFPDPKSQDAAQYLWIARADNFSPPAWEAKESERAASERASEGTPKRNARNGVETESIRDAFSDWLHAELCEMLRLQPDQLDKGAHFLDLGFDSILALQIKRFLEEKTGASLEATLLFKYPSIDELADHFATQHRDRIQRIVAMDAPNPTREISKESDLALHTPGDESPASSNRDALEESKATVDSAFKLPLAREPAEDSPVRKQTNGSSPVLDARLGPTHSNDSSLEPRATGFEPIAVIGVACRFPKAENPEEFWRLIRDGVDAVGMPPHGRFDWCDAENTSSARLAGYVDGIENFDPEFFHISPREASLMDPQQRLFLEVAWEALESAGYTPHRLADETTGIFVGVTGSEFGAVLEKHQAEPEPHAHSGTTPSMVATRVSYLLNLQGPSLTVDTACSSSLVALHLACQSLRTGESNYAIAGGVHLILNPEGTRLVGEVGMLASDGRCKAFDDRADGFVRGEGVAAVLLKPLHKAMDDRDPVLAVIEGTAVNNDGRAKAGLVAPSPRAQQACIEQALRSSGLDPSQIGYIEAHGTGTALGDPVELDGLRGAFARVKSPGRCALGSVKTNVGHLEAAAGIAGIIKVVLALRNRQLPPTLHFQTPNRNLDFIASPFYVNDRLRPWPANVRHAGVSSFGFGGTNVHVIVGEARIATPLTPSTDRPVHLLTLSAHSDSALRKLASQYATYGRSNPQVRLGDLCFTANACRVAHAHRMTCLANSTESLTEQLRGFSEGLSPRGVNVGTVARGSRPRLAMFFPGFVTGWQGMGRSLYEGEPAFRNAFDQCSRLLESLLGESLIRILFPGAGEEDLLPKSRFGEPALVAFEWSLAELWKSAGIHPRCVLGIGVGLYAAAAVAGVLPIRDALQLAVNRSRLLANLSDPGCVAEVFADEISVRRLIGPFTKQVDIAAILSPQHLLIAGETGTVTKVLEIVADQGLAARILPGLAAWHSPWIEPILPAVEETARLIVCHAPDIDWVLGGIGGAWDSGQAPTPATWRNELRRPADLNASLRTLGERGYDIILEVGPASHFFDGSSEFRLSGPMTVISGLDRAEEPVHTLLAGLGSLYLKGITIDWESLDQSRSRVRLALPTYPFERERCWLDAPIATNRSQTTISEARPDFAGHPLLGERIDESRERRDPGTRLTGE
ncbi:MAG: beta-ketoacyl synthase N-terminal-like domain-containing protein [Planctomycetota bacterium]